jgi:GNAT superfamily N-acetyltransferase
MTTWNPKYYEALHEACGFKGVKDLVAYIVLVDRGTELPPRVMEHVRRIQAQSSNVTFRDFDMRNFDRDVNACYDVYNSAWEKNWGFFPMSREEFVHAAKDMKMILDPRMAFIAEVDGQPAGFMLAVPDINYILARNPSGKLLPTGIFKLLFGKKLVKFVRIITLGVKPEHRGNGIFALFTYEAFRRAQKFGYLGGEASWILEDNVEMNKPWQDLGCPQYRRWRIYERAA